MSFAAGAATRARRPTSADSPESSGSTIASGSRAAAASATSPGLDSSVTSSPRSDSSRFIPSRSIGSRFPSRTRGGRPCVAHTIDPPAGAPRRARSPRAALGAAFAALPGLLLLAGGARRRRLADDDVGDAPGDRGGGRALAAVGRPGPERVLAGAQAVEGEAALVVGRDPARAVLRHHPGVGHGGAVAVAHHA